MIKKLLVPVAAISLLAACTNDSGQAVKKGDILVTNMDSTANPADDFFEYANGAWLKANEIPASESSWGIAHLTAKKRYTDIVENVRNAYRLRLEKLDWMGDSTRQKALAKLASIKKKVGYPDKWKDFSAMKIGIESYAANMMAANEWWHKYQISKYGKPVDRDEWEMTPQTYNAYYNPSNNEIVLPAGIFTVPGYRDEELDDALVYGYAAASTVGHEITHGFDDEGRQFDEKGNLQSWWTKQDEAQFTKKAAVLVQQFNNIVAVDSLHINGRASLGENLADLGGVLIGIDAFKNTDAYKKGEKINGLTPLQRFFQGYALGWLYKQRQEELASRILTD
ncbi:peptidase family M13, partial [Ostertagia ostertagi]